MNPKCKMDTLQRLVWDNAVSLAWQVRNDIMRWTQCRHQEHEDKSLTDKIAWYL